MHEYNLFLSISPIIFSWFMCLSIRSSRYVLLAWTADWKGLASFLIATFILCKVSKAELQINNVVSIHYRQIRKPVPPTQGQCTEMCNNDELQHFNCFATYNNELWQRAFTLPKQIRTKLDRRRQILQALAFGTVLARSIRFCWFLPCEIEAFCVPWFSLPPHFVIL